MKKTAYARAGKALKKSDLIGFQAYSDSFEELGTLEEKIEKANRKSEKMLKDATAELRRKEERLLSEQKALQRQHEREEQRLKKELANLKKKEMAQLHREIFVPGTAVQTLDSPDEKSLRLNFSALSEKQWNDVQTYLKRNLLQFKTRMLRSIRSREVRKVDMEATIQRACSTGGMPMELIYEKPKRSHAGLILVLDISGSCKSASKMLLSFMYMLKDIFPGGCRTFVFVNSLHDISDIMSQDIPFEEAVIKVFQVVQTKGVYSNYYRPLESLWKQYHSILKSDSYVIFMGDARNNQNPDGLEYVRNISRKVRKCLWMNTEIMEKWGVKDSIAPKYKKYIPMYQVTNTEELLLSLDGMGN